MKKSTEHIMQSNRNPSAGNGTKPHVASSTVILGDCVEVMKGFEDNQFDLAIVDPPYELNGWHDKGNNRNRQSAKTK